MGVPMQYDIIGKKWEITMYKKIQGALLIILFFGTGFMFFIKSQMYGISNELMSLDRKIYDLKEQKHLLRIELTYLTSAERLLILIEKNPYLLKEKDLITTIQIQTKKQFIQVAMQKFVEKTQMASVINIKDGEI
jgi:cell division protein FtsL